MAKKKIHKWCLSVDFEGGDGAGLFPIESGPKRYKKSKAEIDRQFTELLFASFPPPKVSVVGLSKKEWQKAVKVGKEMA